MQQAINRNLRNQCVYIRQQPTLTFSTNPDTQTISIRGRIQLSLYTSAAVTRGDKIGGSDTMGDTSGCIILQTETSVVKQYYWYLLWVPSDVTCGRKYNNNMGCLQIQS